MIDVSPLLLITDDYAAYKRPKQIQKDAERQARFLARKDAETAAAAAAEEEEDLYDLLDSDSDTRNQIAGSAVDEEEELYNLLGSDSNIRNQIAGPAGGSTAAASSGFKRKRGKQGTP